MLLSTGPTIGEHIMKMTLLEMEPGAAIPEHTHKGPGMRYVLEGAITIAWENGKTETFKAGSTYSKFLALITRLVRCPPETRCMSRAPCGISRERPVGLS